MRAPREMIEWPAGDTGARVLGASGRPRGPFATLIVNALAVLYGVGVRARNTAFNRGLLRTQRATIPVISVGNIVAGGAGKTPFTRWLVERLTERGRNVAIVHGGYGSDEPALHRQWHPSAIVLEERDRVAAVARAAQAGADVAILDDAFQHRRIARDVDIVLLPAESPSTRLLPAGPLREPERALRRADVLVVTRKTANLQSAEEYSRQISERYGRPVALASILPARVRPLTESETKQPPRDVVVVTAIARPDLLLAHVLEDFNVTRMLAYPDHYEFSERDVEHIRAAAAGSAILTTEKDAVKLAGIMAAHNVWVLEQQVIIESGQDVILAALDAVSA